VIDALVRDLERWRTLRIPDRARLASLDRIHAVAVVGASGTGKSSLLDAVRRAGLRGVEVPRRFITRPRRDGDGEVENIHLSGQEFDRLARGGEMGLHWVRPMEGSRRERYGFPVVRADRLAVYSGNNALHGNRASVVPQTALRHIFFVGALAPEPVREERLRRRSPDLWRRAPEELRLRLADRADEVSAWAHLVVENHGALEEAAPTELIGLVRRFAELREGAR
jgi:ribose 1,5-bisphosphokinase PhnN